MNRLMKMNFLFRVVFVLMRPKTYIILSLVMRVG